MLWESAWEVHKSSVLVNIQEKSQKSQALGDASSSTKNRIISETTGTLALLGAGLNSPVPPAQPNHPKAAISERCHCWNSSLQCPGHISRARVASGNTEPSGLLLANNNNKKVKTATIAQGCAEKHEKTTCHSCTCKH